MILAPLSGNRDAVDPAEKDWPVLIQFLDLHPSWTAAAELHECGRAYRASPASQVAVTRRSPDRSLLQLIAHCHFHRRGLFNHFLHLSDRRGLNLVKSTFVFESNQHLSFTQHGARQDSRVTARFRPISKPTNSKGRSPMELNELRLWLLDWLRLSKFGSGLL